MTSDAEPDVALEDVEFYDRPLEDGLEDVCEGLENACDWDYLDILEPSDTVEPTGRRLEDHLGYFAGDNNEFLVAKQNGCIHYLGEERSALETLED